MSRIRADNFTNRLGTGAPLFTNGAVVSGVLTATTIGSSTDTVVIPGNLTVNGTQTTINTQILDVADKTVGVASTSTKTALTQDGAGLVIYGPSDINFTYDATKVAVGLNTSLTVTGVVTATSFSGSGANLTGLNIPAGYSDLDNMLFG